LAFPDRLTAILQAARPHRARLFTGSILSGRMHLGAFQRFFFQPSLSHWFCIQAGKKEHKKEEHQGLAKYSVSIASKYSKNENDQKQNMNIFQLSCCFPEDEIYF